MFIDIEGLERNSNFIKIHKYLAIYDERPHFKVYTLIILATNIIKFITFNYEIFYNFIYEFIFLI